MFKISKDFQFDYAHRVWVQNLRPDFCADGDEDAKCRQIHGHTGVVTIEVKAHDLNPQAMVCDFKELGFAKDVINACLDHKTIIDRNDPLFSRMVNGIIVDEYLVSHNSDQKLPLFDALIAGEGTQNKSVGQIIDASSMSQLDQEFFNSFFIVNFIPTSENLAKWVYEWATFKLAQIDVKVSKVSWSETSSSRVEYSGGCCRHSHTKSSGSCCHSHTKPSDEVTESSAEVTESSDDVND